MGRLVSAFEKSGGRDWNELMKLVTARLLVYRQVAERELREKNGGHPWVGDTEEWGLIFHCN